MSRKYNTSGNYILVVCPNPSVDIFAWVEDWKNKGSNRIVKEEHYPGGKGVHVALALAELGEEVKLFGFWGGPTGSWIRIECEKRYPNLKCIGPGVEGWARSCYTFKSGSEFDDTELLGMGPLLKQEDLDIFYRSFEDFVPDAKCITMSGSWPKGATPDAYAQLIGRANASNKAVFLDCAGEQLENALGLHPHTIHVNRSEVTAYAGKEDIQEAAQELAKHCEFSAVTDGSKGLYLISENSAVHSLCKIDHVHSAVGSGDCLTAGLAAGFAQDLNIIDSARLGAACGAANCMRTDLGLLYKNDVDTLLTQAVVNELSIESVQ